jgi:hypothetical protein
MGLTHLKSVQFSLEKQAIEKSAEGRRKLNFHH